MNVKFHGNGVLLDHLIKQLDVIMRFQELTQNDRSQIYHEANIIRSDAQICAISNPANPVTGDISQTAHLRKNASEPPNFSISSGCGSKTGRLVVTEVFCYHRHNSK
ncbi:hypothetical protein Smp_129860 [Schistosoma mansoni]|uniref:hypothetical protein n=1 Tax=Schistosoma mansoni TaxID=6183 RepID=UPI00022DC7B7|nr:hypothetical protein Smp_129860 [Schistosoma mansoni]|eukprot:XP_018648050.1 hypothetical protein Smp_129860 [Schistosoma mansoni]